MGRSYILIVGTFLLNVVVAVLLDEFISSVQIGKAEQRKHNLVSRTPPLHLRAAKVASHDVSA